MNGKLNGFILTAAVFCGVMFFCGVQTFGQIFKPAGLASIHSPTNSSIICPGQPCSQQIAQTLGRVPVQAAIPLKINQIAGTYNGAGVTIGVISDGYDTCSYCATHAAQDIGYGNLPGAGNPDGNTVPVAVLQDGANSSDEGRAILQIIYGLAPKAKLCFMTAGDTQSSFASAITALANPSGGCGANVIYDDLGFFDEPFFSDGAITQAINQVTANGVTYVTASGSNGAALLDTTFNKIDDAVARGGLMNTNLKLDQVPQSLTLGGFHNFSADPQAKLITRTVTLSNFAYQNILFQWDDPFVPGKISADYNLLVFDDKGNYLTAYSSADNNFSTGAPFETAFLNSGSAAKTYQLVISKTADTVGGLTPAANLRWVRVNFGGTFSDPNAPAAGASIFGHNGAGTAISAASYYYANLSTPETFNSRGPFTNYFDAQGNRLAQPEVRLKPDLSGVDGLDTSFLGYDSDGDTFPNLYGSSASGATIAAVAALTIQAAGGPGHILPAKVKTILDTTAARTNWLANDGYGLANALRATSAAAARYRGTADFDGDGKTDLSVFRPSNAVWYSMNSTSGFSAQAWGLSTDKLAPADYDGDGKTDLTVWRESSSDPDHSYFYILQSSTNTFRSAQFGRIGDNPYFSGDWDGDGKADPTVFRDTGSGQTYFYYAPSSQPSVNFVSVPWGITGDKPVRGDFDGDGKQDAAVFRPSNGVWYILQSSNNQFKADSWGSAGDKLIAADYDGDGKTDLAVLRNAVWYIRQSSDSQNKIVNWGLSSDAAVPADYDGDGKTDIAVYRGGVWYIIQSSNGQIRYDNFGATGDVPIPLAN